MIAKGSINVDSANLLLFWSFPCANNNTSIRWNFKCRFCSPAIHNHKEMYISSFVGSANHVSWKHPHVATNTNKSTRTQKIKKRHTHTHKRQTQFRFGSWFTAFLQFIAYFKSSKCIKYAFERTKYFHLRVMYKNANRYFPPSYITLQTNARETTFEKSYIGYRCFMNLWH